MVEPQEDDLDANKENDVLQADEALLGLVGCNESWALK